MKADFTIGIRGGDFYAFFNNPTSGAAVRMGFKFVSTNRGDLENRLEQGRFTFDYEPDVLARELQ